MWLGFAFKAGLMTSERVLGLRASYLCNLSKLWHYLAIKGRQKCNLAHGWSDLTSTQQHGVRALPLVPWRWPLPGMWPGMWRNSIYAGPSLGKTLLSHLHELTHSFVLSKYHSYRYTPICTLHVTTKEHKVTLHVTPVSQTQRRNSSFT